MPFALGTFGAFIRMPPLLADRRQLFDIGIAGPIAGLVVAVPALALGLHWSEVVSGSLEASNGFMGHGALMSHGVDINSSVLFAGVAKLAMGRALTEGHTVVLHPLAFAGWLGLHPLMIALETPLICAHPLQEAASDGPVAELGRVGRSPRR